MTFQEAGTLSPLIRWHAQACPSLHSCLVLSQPGKEALLAPGGGWKLSGITEAFMLGGLGSRVFRGTISRVVVMYRRCGGAGTRLEAHWHH